MTRYLEILARPEILRCTAVPFVTNDGDNDGCLHEMVAMVEIERYVTYMLK